MDGAGDLRDRVTIQTLTPGSDGQGGHPVTPSTLATVWAKVTPIRADEQLQAAAVGSRIDYDIEIRYRADVTPSMRVLWTPYHGSQKTLEIRGVTPKGGLRARTVLRCGVTE